MRKGLLAAGLLMFSAGADATTTIIDFSRAARDPLFPSFVADGFGGTSEVTTKFESVNTGTPVTSVRITGLRYEDSGYGDLSGLARDDQSFLQFRLIRLDPDVTLRLDSFRIASKLQNMGFFTEVRVFSSSNDLLWESGFIQPPSTGSLLVSPGVSFAGGLTVNLYSATVYGIDQIQFTTLPPAPPPPPPPGVGAIPEPAAWALMIAGFGLVGSALRRRQVGVSLS